MHSGDVSYLKSTYISFIYLDKTEDVSLKVVLEISVLIYQKIYILYIKCIFQIDKKNIFRLYNNVKRSIEKEMLLLRAPPPKKKIFSSATKAWKFNAVGCDFSSF